MDDKNLTVIEHLEELRKRLIYSIIGLAIAFVAGWIFRRDILFILKKPLLEALPPEMRHTILLKIIDKFFIDLKVAFIGAIFLASPVFVYQIWRFVSPGLYPHEKRAALPLLFFGTLFFAGGVAFCYFLVFPFAFDFLVQYSLSGGNLELFGTDSMAAGAMADKLEIALKEHISLTASILFAFGLAFETPVFMFILGAVGIVTPEWFAAKRKYAVVLAFVFAAILTPPDPWTQVSLGIPLVGLYELGIQSVRLYRRFVKKKPADDSDVAEADEDADRE